MIRDIGCVVLTQDKRPDDLRRAVESVLGQRDVNVDIVVVGNGAKPEDLPGDVRVLALPENIGIPAGRNAGIGEVAGDLVLFLDDDAYLASEDFLLRAATMFDDDPALGVVQPRVLDPEGGPTPRRFVPRLRVGNPARSSDVVALWEGTCLARRSALDAAGPWPAEFFYMHEGIDLTWRVMEAGYTVRYSADLSTYHPAVAPERHVEGRYFSARNRVWLARRNLPVVVGALYVATWFLLDALRLRTPASAKQHLRGYYAGLRMPCGRRTAMRWHTVWRMARLGRPPII
jgi:GT2 family glycosyltransferase